MTLTPALRSDVGHEAPSHKAALTGGVLILDNLGSHKGRAARAAIRAAGAHLLFLPPYSPDLNPIEQLFSKLKHFTRAGEPRTVEATWRRVGHVLDLVAPDECANYLTNSGYASVCIQHALGSAADRQQKLDDHGANVRSEG